MEISNANSSVTNTASAIPVSDLSALLLRTGPIEARVLKLLDSGLLLGSRLGEILTSNNFKFKVGDRLILRIDASASKPLLRVTAAPAQAIVLDLRDAPTLTRLLLPGRAQLASVTTAGPDKMQLVIGEQRVNTAAQPGIRKGQLLSLLQSADRRSVEIRPVDARPVLKALVMRLIAAQYDSGRPPALVNLLRLLHQADPKAVRGDARATTERQQSVPSPAVASKFTGNNAKPVMPGAAVSTTATPPASSASPSTALKNSSHSFPTAAIKTTAPQLAPKAPLDVTAEPRGAESLAPPKLRSNATGETRADAARQSTPSPGVALNSKQEPSTLASQQQTTQQTTQLSPRLQLLLQSLDLLTGFNPARLKQWFEFSGLLRTAESANPANARPNPFQLLRQMSAGEFFVAEKPPAAVAGSKSQQSAGSASQASTHANPAGLVKEAVVLLDQALGQNLMQRALLGLQQETQQPLSLSMALPYIDQGEVKSLQIELEQRNQAEDEDDRSWEVRINIEPAGLGKLCCHIILQGNQVSASFFSVDEQTRTRIDHALTDLREQLAGAGFVPGEFFSFAGVPARPSRPQGMKLSESLLDIKV